MCVGALLACDVKVLFQPEFYLALQYPTHHDVHSVLRKEIKKYLSVVGLDLGTSDKKSVCVRYIHTYIFLRTLLAQGGGPSTGQRGGFFIACSRP